MKWKRRVGGKTELGGRVSSTSPISVTIRLSRVRYPDVPSVLIRRTGLTLTDDLSQKNSRFSSCSDQNCVKIRLQTTSGWKSHDHLGTVCPYESFVWNGKRLQTDKSEQFFIDILISSALPYFHLFGLKTKTETLFLDSLTHYNPGLQIKGVRGLFL